MWSNPAFEKVNREQCVRAEAPSVCLLTYKPLLAILGSMASSRVVALPDQNVTFQNINFAKNSPSCSASQHLCHLARAILADLPSTPQSQIPREKLQPEPCRSRPQWNLRGAGAGRHGSLPTLCTNWCTQTDPKWVGSPSWDYFFLEWLSSLGSTAILQLLLFEDVDAGQWVVL